jgi:hypothetical protein
MKRIVVCFDGTWNKPKRGEKATNVASLYRSILGVDRRGIPVATPAKTPTVPTIKWYDYGVGTQWGELIRGGVFGYGLSLNIREGYKFLVDNYEEGNEIYLFGFSRGAYTARSLAGLIRKIGLLRKVHAPKKDPDDNELIVRGYEIYRERDDTPDTQVAEEFKGAHSWQNVKIKFLGVWDTVGALGLPFGILEGLNERYAFHDTKLSGIIENAYHAVAVDEHRKDYEPTLWDSPQKDNQHMEQVWFIGAHADVGGGSKKLQFSDIALRWMQEKAQLDGQGLEFDPDRIPDPGDLYLRTRFSDSFKDMLGGWIPTYPQTLWPREILQADQEVRTRQRIGPGNGIKKGGTRFKVQSQEPWVVATGRCTRRNRRVALSLPKQTGSTSPIYAGLDDSGIISTSSFRRYFTVSALNPLLLQSHDLHLEPIDPRVGNLCMHPQKSSRRQSVVSQLERPIARRQVSRQLSLDSRRYNPH